ncbi:citrate lyase acyl carrier protein [uncultured Phascolarctobacterium sp.]|uniref:citrate lyase acyl carrier protein n=1 Tax=Phascolarctobacterium sp. TaxID=2049039 RepID=UPI0025E4C50C|nr:citrate lyase acyl carrier protein [uncultured Phascolarctobacterium sp.]
MVFKGREITAGTNNKGDVMVTVEFPKKNGVEIEIVSKALDKYGKAIDSAVREVLMEQKIENAHILVEDYGALDFVIRARVETALQRAVERSRA